MPNATMHRHSRTPGAIDPLAVPSSLLTGLKAYWNMDEASGTRVDSLGLNNLSVTGTVTSTAGKLGNSAVYLAGANYLSVAAALTTSGVSRSLSMWIFPTDITGNKSYAEGAPTYNSGVPMWEIINQGTSSPIAVYHGGNYRTGTTVFANNTWYHLVYIFDASTNNVALYINGNQEVNVTVADANSAATTFIGNGANGCNAHIDEVGLWSRAITAAEVAQLYNGGNAVTYPLFA